MRKNLPVLILFAALALSLCINAYFVLLHPSSPETTQKANVNTKAEETGSQPKFPLIATDEDIALYGVEPNGMILSMNYGAAYFPWPWTHQLKAKDKYPIIFHQDYDKDERKELAVLNYTAFGTDTSTMDLHVVEIDDSQGYSGHRCKAFSLTSAEAAKYFEEKISVTQSEDLSSITIDLNEKSETFAITEYLASPQKLGGICLNKKVEFLLGTSSFKLRLSLGLSFPDYGPPVYIGTVYADIFYQEGAFAFANDTFKLTKPRSVPISAADVYRKLLLGNFDLLNDLNTYSNLGSKSTVQKEYNLFADQWEFTMVDLDGDGSKELFMKLGEATGIFHYTNNTAICWGWDTMEAISNQLPLKNNQILQTYEYGDASGWWSFLIFYRFDASGGHIAMDRLTTVTVKDIESFRQPPVPEIYQKIMEEGEYHFLNGKMISDKEFESYCKDNITDQMIPISKWFSANDCENLSDSLFF